VIRVFVDATVLFSAARNPDGINRDLLNVAEKRGDTVLLCNWVVVDEADIKLMYTFQPSVRDELARLAAKHITECAVAPVHLNQTLATLTPDPHDVPVLAGAVSAGADWLVTSNVKHFGHLYDKTVRGVLVLSTVNALRRLTSGTRTV